MPVFPLQNDTFLWYNEAILREGGKCMAREYDLYLKTAVFEKCRKDKDKVNTILFHTALHYISDGYGYINGVRLGPGQFFCIPKNSHAKYYPDPEEPWSYFYFDLHGDGYAQALTENGIDLMKPWGDFFCMEEIPKLFQLYLQYQNLYAENRLFLDALMNMLLSLHMARPAEREHSSKAYRHVEEIKEYLKAHMQQKISIEDVAQQYFLSRPYIRNLFVKYEKMSPKQYLQKIRMERAAELLLQTRYDIGLIASSVGYGDLFAFSRTFKQFYGMSPTEYRRQAGG